MSYFSSVCFTRGIASSSMTLMTRFRLSKTTEDPVGSRQTVPHEILRNWWSRSDLNRRPPPCKGGALPAELLPQSAGSLVGLGGFEPPASRLSGVRSNQLSYRPLQRTSKGSSKTGSRWPTGRPRCGHRHPATDSVRKEVIQPQVLLRLPCYDFTPIADHTFDSCPPEGLAHRLLVQPTFVM